MYVNSIYMNYSCGIMIKNRGIKGGFMLKILEELQKPQDMTNVSDEEWDLLKEDMLNLGLLEWKEKYLPWYGLGKLSEDSLLTLIQFQIDPDFVVHLPGKFQSSQGKLLRLQQARKLTYEDYSFTANARG